MEKESRPSFNAYMFNVCRSVASRSTCRHRDQGAVIVKDKTIISTGYNGAPRGVKDCLQRGYCSKAENLSCLAEGLHGESNAIISAARNGISVEGATMYCIFSPCRACCNMIRNAGITGLVYLYEYTAFPQGPMYLASLGVSVGREEGGKLQLIVSPIMEVENDECE